MAHRESKRCAKFFVTQCVRSAMTCRNFAWSNSELASKRTGTASNMTTCIGLTSGPRPLQIICVERTTDADVRAQSPGHEPDRPARAVCACGAAVRGLRGGAQWLPMLKMLTAVSDAYNSGCGVDLHNGLALVHFSVILRTPSIHARWGVPAACRVPRQPTA